MVDVSYLRSLEKDVNAVAEELGLQYESLTDAELTRFGRSYERQFVTTLQDREMSELYMRHLPEALLGAKVAKKQMGAEIGGEQPASGKVGGPLFVRAAYFGIGDDWCDINGIYKTTKDAWQTGGKQSWIHSGTSLMNGTTANPVKIGENALHVIFGVGSMHPSPKLESVKFTIDGREKPYMQTWFQLLANSSMKFKEFDKAYVFAKGNTVLAETFFAANRPAAVTEVDDIPFLIGVSYVKEPQLRVFDPATLPGTTNNVILTV